MVEMRQLDTNRGIYFLLFLVMLSWTLGIVVAKWVGTKASPLEISFWRWMLASLFLFPFSARELCVERKLLLRDILKIIFLGLFIAGGSTLLILSVQFTSVFNASLVSAVQPAATLLLVSLLFWRRISLTQLSGIIMAAVGVLVLLFEMDIVNIIDLSLNRGDLLVLFAVFLYSAYTIYATRWLYWASATTIMFLSSVIATLLLGLLCFFLNAFYSFVDVNITLAGAVLFLALIPTAFATTLWNYSVARIGPNKASAFINLLPLLGAIWSLLFFGETLYSYHIVGGFLTCLGITMSLIEKNKVD